jgi:Na+-translocating ferredoxin:NAD+ oxidoreductase subunit A
MNILVIALAAIITSNVVLSRFLGVCPLLGVSKKTENAIGMSFALIFVVVMSGILSYAFYHLVLAPLGLEYLELTSFILIIAVFVQFVEMFLKKYVQGLYNALGIYLPLITTNCIVLLVALENITLGFDFLEMLVYSIAVPVGYMMVIVVFSIIRTRIDGDKRLPTPFKGNAIALIVVALMALAFAGFGGIV